MSAASLPAAYGDAARLCEQALLGAVMLRNSRYAACLAVGLKSQHFLSDLNARIWHEIGALLGRQQEANPVTLTPRLAGERDFEAAGGHRYLGRLATCTVDIGIGDIGIGDIASHAAATREHAQLDWQREAGAFRDYWTAKAGPDAWRHDWSAMWRRWLKQSYNFVAKPSRGKAAMRGGGGEPWDIRLQAFAANGEWMGNLWGAPPNNAGCRAPPELLQRYGFHATSPPCGKT